MSLKDSEPEDLRLYTITEVSEMWSVSEDWVYAEIRAGRIVPTDLANNADPKSTRRKWRISGMEMRRVILSRTPTL